MSDPQTAVQQLLDKGYSQIEIAKSLEQHEGIHIAQSTVNRIKNGKQTVRFDVGAGLIRLADKLPKKLQVIHGPPELEGRLERAPSD